MKKIILGILFVLCIAMAVVVKINVVTTNAEQSQNVTVDPNLFKEVPLNDSEINANWPNLPSVETLMNSTPKVTINTDEIGKTDPSLPIPSNPTGYMLPFEITNYTADAPNPITGQIDYNLPHIWLQYNATLWVLVPPAMLVSANQSNSAQNEKASSQNSPLTWPNLWALGIYSNPAQINGGATVTAAFSYGSYGMYSPGVGNYFYSDILTIFDGSYYIQIGMYNGYGYGTAFVIQAFDNNGIFVISPTVMCESISSGQLYSEFIRYNPNLQTPCWQAYWNQNDSGMALTDGQTSIQTGYQPNVCAESNDFSSTHFGSASYNIGGMYNTTYYLPAIGYYYNGNWHPQSTSDSVPSAYTYYGNSTTYTFFYVGTYPPQAWFGEQKNTSQTKESLTLGKNIAVPAEAHQIW